MKIIRANAKKTCGRLRRVLCSSFVVAAVLAAAGAVASSRVTKEEGMAISATVKQIVISDPPTRTLRRDK